MRFSKLSYRNFKNIGDKTLTTYILLVYMFIILMIYPFYMKEGYVNISEHKFVFYLYSSVGAVLLLSVTGINVWYEKLFKNPEHIKKRLLLTDVFVLLFIIATVISFAVSSFKDIAILGTDGWYMGLITLLLVSILYFFTSRLFDYEDTVVYMAVAASFVVYLLGICDRFSFYIIPLSQRDPSFISTLGNINWFMGYYSVMTPLGVSILLHELKKRRRNIKLYMLFIYVFTAFTAGFAQGSESVFLFDAALFTGLLFLCYKGKTDIENLLLLLIMWGLSGQSVRFLKVLFKNGYNYDSGGLCDILTSNSITLLISTIACVILLFVTYFRKRNRSFFEKQGMLLVFILIGVSAVAYVVMGLLKTKASVSFIPDHSMFFFDERFGSGRGHAFKAAVDTFKDAGIWQKLIGVGPDCFKEAVYALPGRANLLRQIWPHDLLINAHNELLTMLINEGVLGTLAYVGIFVSYIVSAFKRGRDMVDFGIGLSVFCYLLHNMISFAQVLNTPFIFLLMGIGTAKLFDKIEYKLYN